MNRTLRLVWTTAALTLFAAFSAYADRDAGTASVIRNQFQSDLVRIKGNLSCTFAAKNDGGPCDLKLRDSQNGKVYSLTHSASAMQFYQKGIKDVLVEGAADGNRAAATSIMVIRVSAL